MYRRLKTKELWIAIVIGAVALFGAKSSTAQETQADDPIVGTIEVSEGDDFAALAEITAEQALAAAEAELPGATLEENELDEEDGYLVYEVEFVHEGQDVDVLVDAGNGEVLAVERDDEDEDDDD